MPAHPTTSLAICFLANLALLLPGNFAAAEEPRAATDNAIRVAPADWPWWRGPTRDGVATPGQTPPTHWSETENILWKAPVTGRGHGSATVVGDQVFLATADPVNQVQGVACYDRTSGKLLWDTAVHKGGFETKGNAKSTLASSSVACDGTRLYINFLHAGAIYTTALSREGKQLWQTKITDYILHQGFGSSPAIYESLVIVSADNKGTGLIVGLDRSTGEFVWKHERPQFPNYTSPIILKVAGRDQLFFTGCNLVTSLEPLSGKSLWEIEGSTTECVTSTVTDGKLIFTSGGYPKNHMSAVRADGSGKLVWENEARVYVPSMLIKEGFLYTIQDAGVAVCWEAATGKEVWKQRLGGTFTASPVLVNDLVYATNEAGKTFVFKADPSRFIGIAENQLGDEAFASAVICGSRIYMRLAVTDGDKRQEFLYCIGDKSTASAR